MWWLADIFRDSYIVWKHQVSQPIMMKKHTYFMYLLHLYVPYYTHHPHLSPSLLSLKSFVANIICWYVWDLKYIFLSLSFYLFFNQVIFPGRWTMVGQWWVPACLYRTTSFHILARRLEAGNSALPLSDQKTYFRNRMHLHPSWKPCTISKNPV